MAEGAEVFPFDPRARVECLRGLQKLRAIEDRELADHLFRLWEALPAPRAARSRRPPPKRAAQLELAGLA